MTLTRIQSVQFGKYSTTTDFSSTAPTLRFKEPISADLYPRDRQRIERPLFRPDNHPNAGIYGTKGLDALGLTVQVRGFAANAGAALAAATETEVGDFLDCISGGAATDPSGTATTTTGGTGSSGTLTVTSGTNVANGVGVLFQTDGDPVVREVVSGGGTGTLTLDRDFSGTVANGGVLARSAYWTFDPSISKHTHAFIRAEGEDWRRDYYGCLSGGTLRVNEGQPATLEMSWMPTSWADAAEANPSFTAPTAGAYVLGVNCGLWIGDDKLIVKSAEVSFGHTIVPRSTINGSDGVHGYVVTAKVPVITCRVYHGTSGLTFGEVADSTGNVSINKIQGLTNSAGSAVSAGQVESTYDVALQVGNIATGAMYIRCPAAVLRGRVVDDNGMECVDLEIRPTRPTSGTPMRVHIF